MQNTHQRGKSLAAGTTIYVSKQGSRAKTYHLDPECTYAKRVRTLEAKRYDQAPLGVRACSACAGGTP